MAKLVRLGIILAIVIALAIGGWAFALNQHESQQLDLLQQKIDSGDYSAAIKDLAGIQLANYPFNASNRSRLVWLRAIASRKARRPQEFDSATRKPPADASIASKVANEGRLYSVQEGRLEGNAERTLALLLRSGCDPIEARIALVQGLLRLGQPRDAKPVLSDLESQAADAPTTQFLKAMLAQVEGRSDDARQLFEKTIQTHPRFELAYLALAEHFTTDGSRDLAKSAKVLQHAIQLFPSNSELPTRYVSVQRQIGNASASYDKLNAIESPSLVEQLELVDSLSDQGRFDRAASLLKTAMGLNESQVEKKLDTAFQLALDGRAGEGAPILTQASLIATLLAYSGQTQSAHRIFDRVNERVGRVRRIADLETLMSIYPQATELQVARRATSDLKTPFGPPPADTFQVLMLSKEEQRSTNPTSTSSTLQRGVELYLEHCSQCHGVAGDGLGRAAIQLTPAPRSFTGEPMRYVSAANRLATAQDLRDTISKGLQGVSMPGFAKLTAEEIDAIIAVVRRFQRIGLERRYAAAEGESTAKQDWIRERMEPSDPITPQVNITSANNSSAPITDAQKNIEQGKVIFERVGCNRCHIADSTTRYFDSLGRTLTARRLGIEPLRRGSSDIELARRILLGIPGTPHPAVDLPSGELAQLIAYVQSLQQSVELKSSNYQRSSL